MASSATVGLGPCDDFFFTGPVCTRSFVAVNEPNWTGSLRSACQGSRNVVFLAAQPPRLPGIRAYYEKAPEPKKLILLDGSAHAQFLFQTEHADRVVRETLRFLCAL